MNLTKASFGTVKRAQRAVAAIEMAMMMPMLVTLLLGGVDVSRYIILHQKTERIAYSIADIVAQSQSVSKHDLDDVLAAAAAIMEPFPFTAYGRVIISSVYRAADGSTQKTVWRYEGGGTLDRKSIIGNVNATATLPSNLILNTKDNAIVTEVYFKFEPFFPGAEVLVDGDIYKVAVYKPRLGLLTTPPT